MNYIIRIELQRVQTFLFAVPRLADIVGANALLGETMRYRLPKLAINCSSKAPKRIPNTLADQIQSDPINRIESKHNTNIILDNPKELWKKGILARDGGHFRTCFNSVKKATEFTAKAQSLLREQLPGLRFEIDRIEQGDSAKAIAQNSGLPCLPEATAINLFSLSVLQHCEEIGNGIATSSWGGKGDKRRIGLAAQQRKNHWQKFKQGETDDIAALMQRKLGLAEVDTFEALCQNDYLALIHADGNGLGKAMQKLQKQDNWLDNEAQIEHFFQTMRVTLRCALEKAVEQLFKHKEKQGLHILMLGGDDLLVACRAPLALEFVQLLGQALVDIQQESTGFSELTIGAGVAIAKPAFPFHKLHEMAEELASSAKRLIREMENPVSVVDWATCSESWYGDLKQVRRQSQLLHYSLNGQTETLALSAKPYRILNATTPDNSTETTQWSLAALLEKQSQCADLAARSQLRHLVQQMKLGKRQADLVFHNLQISSPATWQVLQDSGFKDSIWQATTDSQCWLSYFADLVEITEIPKLQTEKLRTNKQPEQDTQEKTT